MNKPLLRTAAILTLASLAIVPARSATADDAATTAPAQTSASPPTPTPARAPAKGIVPIHDYTGDFWNRSALLGDFNGGRTKLAEKGVQFDIDWTQEVQSVVDGGLNRTTAYGGNLDALIHLDLMRMGLLPGAFVTIRAESRYGISVNGDVGTILPVNTPALFPLTDSLDEGIPITITNLNYTQFLSEHFLICLGKVDILDGDPNEFASGRGKDQFMNFNFIFNPVAALRLPYSTLGVACVWLPNENVTVKASLINTADSSTTSGFEDFGDGLTATVEADFQYRLKDLPGGMNISGLYSFDQDFTKIGGELIFQPGQGLSIENEDDTWAIFWSMWQYLYVMDPSNKPINTGNGTPDHKGIGIFARAGIADQDTNPVEWSASIGVGGRGMVPSRDNDTFGIGYYYTSLQQGRFSGVTGIDDHSQGLEAYYNLAITPAANLTFDVQVQDTALPDTDTAIVLGMRLNVAF